MSTVNSQNETSIYARKGYASRAAYLRDMAEEYGVPVESVFAVADMLGPNEDFDGLISSLEDYDGE